jgi:hypothetical protein
MGMFDSVFASCPRCGEAVEFQSKAGECVLASYDTQSVPVEIAESLDGQVASCKCGETIRIVISLPPPPNRVQMAVE